MSSKKDTISTSIILNLNDSDESLRTAAHALKNGMNISQDGGITWLKGRSLLLHALGELIKSRKDVQKVQQEKPAVAQSEQTEKPKKIRNWQEGLKKDPADTLSFQ